VDVQHGTLLPAALCRLLPGVAGAVLVVWQQLQDSLLCLCVGVYMQRTFTLGDLLCDQIMVVPQ
jgi:hypothetical protein